MDEKTIVKKLVTESPTIKKDKIEIPALEKILVDILIDKKLFAAQERELDFFYKYAFKKYGINKAKMRRYSDRRNEERELETNINSSMVS